MEAEVPISAFLSEIPWPAWVIFGLAVASGWHWHFPIALLLLALFITARSMRRRGVAMNCWQNTAQPTGGTGRSGWGWGPGGMFNFGNSPQPNPAAPTSNRAFDEYRAETLRRLEDEQKEFMEYLERLRQARDKQEFDQFMADRRRVEPAN
jgi:hypothetical protein